MRNQLLQLDRLLRGDATRPDQLRGGELAINIRTLAIIIVALGALYGLCMGSFSLLKEVPASINDPFGRYWQLMATTIKVPALFFLTLIVTFPSLYVFNALVGSRLTVRGVLALLIASLAINLAVLSSLGPIVLFFSVSTKSYAFIQLLNVVVFTVAGVLGLAFLLQTLHRLTASLIRTDHAPSAAGGPIVVDSASSQAEVPLENVPLTEDPSALEMPNGETLARHTRLVFGCWVVVFSLVGAQMGWVLRPFIGSPGMPFTFFRERTSNFFEAVLKALGALLGG